MFTLSRSRGKSAGLHHAHRQWRRNGIAFSEHLNNALPEPAPNHHVDEEINSIVECQDELGDFFDLV